MGLRLTSQAGRFLNFGAATGAHVPGGRASAHVLTAQQVTAFQEPFTRKSRTGRVPEPSQCESEKFPYTLVQEVLHENDQRQESREEIDPPGARFSGTGTSRRRRPAMEAMAVAHHRRLGDGACDWGARSWGWSSQGFGKPGAASRGDVLLCLAGVSTE